LHVTSLQQWQMPTRHIIVFVAAAAAAAAAVVLQGWC
jgi:hypothetical protein